jgi:TM2 domain-containing membrane protein YozV
MNKIIIAVLMLLFTGRTSLFADTEDLSGNITAGTYLIPGDSSHISQENLEKLRIISGSDISAEKKKKLISAMLAFPFPFGFMGAHRVMLGCKPWVPVVYMATFGGCFGLLPMIDFCAILLSKDITQFENNPHVFMWMK